MWDGYLEFSASVELAETLNSFLSVHHGGHCGAMLQAKTRIQPVTQHIQHLEPSEINSQAALLRSESEGTLTQIQGCLRACSAVIRLAGLMVNI